MTNVTGLHRSIIPLLLLCALVGCQKKGGVWTLKSAPSGSEQVAMAVSDDPDERAKAITYWSSQGWGYGEAYMKYYASAARTDESPVVRALAVTALGKSGKREFVPDMVEVLKDGVPAVRVDAAIALDRVPGEPAVTQLQRQAVQDDSVDARVAAIRALRHYRRADVLTTLVRCLADHPFAVSYQAHAALVYLTGQDAGFDAARWQPIVEKLAAQWQAK